MANTGSARRRKYKMYESLVLNYRMINLKGRNNKQDLGVDYSIIINGP
jgi:hypothetical protein